MSVSLTVWGKVTENLSEAPSFLCLMLYLEIFSLLQETRKKSVQFARVFRKIFQNMPAATDSEISMQTGG
jgi:hypothetical protein